MKHIGTRSFTDMLSEINYPGDYYRLTSKNPSTRLLRTCANQRARENFVYWQTEPKPTKHGIYINLLCLYCCFCYLGSKIHLKIIILCTTMIDY